MTGPATPSALLGEPADRLLAAVAGGHPLRRACGLAGVSYATVRKWLLKGGDPASRARAANTAVVWEPYHAFAKRLRAVQAAADASGLPSRHPGHEPAAISPAQQEAIVDYLRRSGDYPLACRLAGVREQTFYAWLRRGGYLRYVGDAKPLDPSLVIEPYRSFVARVVAAEECFLAQDD